MASPAQLAITKLTDTAKHVLNQRRPWSEITDKTAYSKPANVTEATSRIRKNLTYFKVNYLLFVLGAVVTCLLTHPLSLFLLGGLGSSWVYLFAIRSEPLVIQGRTTSEREKLLGMSAISLILIFFLSSVGSVLFMGLGLGAAGVAAHGALRQPDDLFLEDAADNESFFAFLKPPAASAATI